MVEDVEQNKSKLLQYFMKTVSGFFMGVGFSIALLVIFISAGYIYEHFYKEETKPRVTIPEVESYKSTRVEFDENSGLIIQKHEPQKFDSKLIILGSVKNNGKVNWDNISIEVELFDSNKDFVDQCSTYISGTVKINQARNFKVTCGGCNNEPMVDFSTYEIKIVNAFQGM